MPGINDWKIVLIDDEVDIRQVISIVLCDAGYNVTCAQDGESGIRLCQEVGPQIVITDIRMPGTDGIQVLEAVKKQNSDIEVIVVTAFGEMELAIRALQLDASDFITKPIDEEILMVALKRAQDRYTSRKQLRDYTAFLEKEKAQTAQELIRTYSLQKNLIESSMDGILACDKDETIIIFNKSMEKMLGYPKAEVLRKMSIDRLFASEEAARFRKELTGKQFGGKNCLSLYETKLIEKSGDTVPVQMSAAIILDQGRESGVVCFFRDLREIRKLERELADQASILHQDKMMSLGRLSASVVHEINNPLFGILNYIRLMIRILNRGALTEGHFDKFRRYLNLVENETERCSQIVSSLLAFSRKATPSFGPVMIEELLQRCIILSQHKLELSNIRLVSDIKPQIPPVKGDFSQLQQCVINLIFNAVDAMPDGGSLSLTGSYDSKENKVIITVKDTGHGVGKEDLPHIFEPFYTTKKEGYGVGLGLSTVFGIIEHHNGTVRVESQPGEGATFILQFPVYPQTDLP